MGNELQEENKISLSSEDWDLLLPGVEHTIGKTKLMIKPLGLESLSKVLDALHKLLNDWKDVLVDGQKPGNQNKKKAPQNVTEQILLFFPKVSNLIQEHGIHIISDLSGIKMEDVKRLPPTIAVELFDKCLAINITSQEGLEKNLKGLADQIVSLLANRTSQTPPETK